MSQDMRLSFELDDALLDEARSAYTWRVTWTAIYGGLAIGAVALVPFTPKADQPAYWIGAISSGVSALYSWFLPLDVEASPGVLARPSDAHGSAARRSRVRAFYETASADERSRVTWPWHALNAVLSLIPAIILWVGYDQLAYGLIQLGVGVVLGEAALLTQPTSLAAPAAASAHAPIRFSPTRLVVSF